MGVLRKECVDTVRLEADSDSDEGGNDCVYGEGGVVGRKIIGV